MDSKLEVVEVEPSGPWMARVLALQKANKRYGGNAVVVWSRTEPISGEIGAPSPVL
jgi:hypothetical protein